MESWKTFVIKMGWLGCLCSPPPLLSWSRPYLASNRCASGPPCRTAPCSTRTRRSDLVSSCRAPSRRGGSDRPFCAPAGSSPPGRSLWVAASDAARRPSTPGRSRDLRSRRTAYRNETQVIMCKPLTRKTDNRWHPINTYMRLWTGNFWETIKIKH